jgi:hippurate hydrolase
VVALQSVVSRRLCPHDTAVLSVTQIHGGEAWNVLPDGAVVRGTVRCYSEQAQNHIQTLLRDISEGVAQTHGATVSVTYNEGYPATVNAPDATDIALAAAAQVSGRPNVRTGGRPSMASEDFAFMLNAKPGAYIWLGVDTEHGATVPLHNEHFDFNDEALEIGARYWMALVRAAQRASAQAGQS